MSWNIGGKKGLFLEKKSTLGLYHFVLTTPKFSSQKPILIAAEMQQLPDIAMLHSEKEISCLNWAKFNGRRKYL